MLMNMWRFLDEEDTLPSTQEETRELTQDELSDVGGGRMLGPPMVNM